MNIFKKIGSFFKSIFDKIRSEKFRKAVEAVVMQGVDLFEYVEPVVSALAKATPTSIDDWLLAAAKRAAVKLDSIYSMPDDERGPYLQKAARDIVRARLLDEVLKGKSIKVGDVEIASAEDIYSLSNSLLNHAIELAYQAVRKAATA